MNNQENSPYFDSDVVEQCYCNDGALVAVLVVKNHNNKFDLYGCSEIFGYGSALYEKKLFEFDFDEIIPYNSMDNISYVAVRKNNLWGLIEIKTSFKELCEYDLTAKISHTKDEIAKIRESRIVNDFDAKCWLEAFHKASLAKTGFHELRTEIFTQTLKFVKQGYYYVNNKMVNTLNPHKKTFFFDKEEKPINKTNKYETQISVVEADCIEAAQTLQEAGHKVCVLNMASRQNPGGGVMKGMGAQEENIFRRTDLFQSLYQFADYACQYDLERHEKSYPLDRNFGGIYSEDVLIFRGSEKKGYCLLDDPYKLNFVSVAAMNRPDLVRTNSGYRIIDLMIEPTKNKIRTILRIGAKFGNDCMVLSAFGCGAFCNPPEHIAQIFKEVLSENEFAGVFKKIVFAIIDDHNSRKSHNPEGNLIPFIKQFI